MNAPPVKKLMVMADYSCGLWLASGGIDPEFLGVPSALCERIHSWLRDYCEDDDAPTGFDRSSYNAEGHAIALELKRCLGSDYYVTYRYLLPADTPSADAHWTQEQPV